MGVEAAWSAQPTGPAQHPRLLQHKVLPAQGKVLTSCPSFIYIYIYFYLYYCHDFLHIILN